MRIKTVLSILIALSTVLLTGCWDYNEYESLALVSAMGFDTDSMNSNVTMTLEYIVPGGSNSSSNGAVTSAIVTATGLSISDALTKIQEATGKKLFYGYMEEMVIGENAGKQMMKDIIGVANRTPVIRTSAYIVLTNGTAEKVLSTTDPDISESTGKNIHDLIDQSVSSGGAFPVRLQDFLEALAISGEEPVAPMISVENNTSSNASSTTYEKISEQGSIELGELKTGYDKISGIAIFQKSDLVGWLAGRECTGLGWITNKKLAPYETVRMPNKKSVQNTLIFRVTNSKCSIKVNVDSGRPVVYINSYVEANLRKYSKDLNLKSLTPDTVSVLEKGLANNISTDISDAIEKGQKELKTDVFGIGFNFYRQYPALWHSQYEKRWQVIFPTIKVHVKVTAKVTNTGTNIEKFEVK